jgi:two-component system, OmpR family, sensor histidine kinase KdpD
MLQERLQDAARRTLDSGPDPFGVASVRADLRLVKKALAQLLENARKYSPPEELITVSVEMNGDFVMTSVIDRGNGIDTHEQHLIFDELHRRKDQRHLGSISN